MLFLTRLCSRALCPEGPIFVVVAVKFIIWNPGKHTFTLPGKTFSCFATCWSGVLKMERALQNQVQLFNATINFLQKCCMKKFIQKYTKRHKKATRRTLYVHDLGIAHIASELSI